MYESFYGFHKKPFLLLPDAAFLYLGKRRRWTLAKLQYGLMDQTGFTVVTGETGCGKTTLVSYLIEQFGQHFKVGLINNVHAGFNDLLGWILNAFEIQVDTTQDVARHRALWSFLAEQHRIGQPVLLIIDEAQNMTPQLHEQLRVLTNLNSRMPRSFQVLLVGQPELRETLRRRELRQFTQRIAVLEHLPPLDLEDTEGYIDHRVHVAGGRVGIFALDAVRAIYRYSRGIPRLINLLCDAGLWYGHERARLTIDEPLVTEVAAERMELGLWTVSRPHLADWDADTQQVQATYASVSSAFAGPEPEQEIQRNNGKSHGEPLPDRTASSVHFAKKDGNGTRHLGQKKGPDGPGTGQKRDLEAALRQLSEWLD